MNEPLTRQPKLSSLRRLFTTPQLSSTLGVASSAILAARQDPEALPRGVLASPQTGRA